MTTKQQLIALLTLINHELTRMFRIAIQVFLPPIITTFLYFIIFGTIIGQRIGPIHQLSYAEFIAPGLIMLSVISNAYANVSNSLFSLRFQKSIEELLVSPMHYSLILLGFTLGGVIRGLIVGVLVFLVACCFLTIDVSHIPMSIVVIVLVATLFSLAGFLNGLLARNFDDVALIPTFIIAPLTYLGGVFYTITMLPNFWQKVSLCNPIFYMVTALRQAMIGKEHIHLATSMTIICILLISLALLNLVLLKRGRGLRE